MSGTNSDYLRYIRENVSLSEVCRKLDISVKGRGVPQLALCPFHNDRRPSLNIYSNHFHCYSCRAHGDLFDLIKKVKNVDFRGALSWVEDQFPFVLGQKPIRRPGHQPDRTPNQVARDYYAAENSKIPDQAATERGYSPEFLRNAEVYGTNGNVLCAKMTREEQDELLRVQLIQRNYQVSPEDFSPYQDYFFKARLLFTLRDIDHRVVGFAGRSLSESEKPKYLYTRGLPKDTLLYRMDAVDSRWNQSREDANACQLYIVEGLFDALRLESLGMDAAAVLGSRLTNGQLRILEQLAEQQRQWDRTMKLYCFLDSDKAGVEGAFQLLRSVWRSDVLRNVPVSIILAPESILHPENNLGKDPDEFLKGCSAEQASDWIKKHRLNPMEFLLRRFIDRDTLAYQNDSLDEEQLSVEDQLKQHSLEDRWRGLPLLTKVRILNQIDNLFSDMIWEDLLEIYFDLEDPKADCFALVLLEKYLRRRGTASSGQNYNTGAYCASPYLLALEMARTSYQQESIALDDASWDRLSAGIELVGGVFDNWLSAPKDIPVVRPLLAFSTPKDVDQDRLKALPDHEELLFQHYLLYELLQEDFYPGYARMIPAVRYDPLLNSTYTTGLGYIDTFQNADCKAVSFAYQVDMSVLRQEQRPTNGVFRHYYACWCDFISFLQDGIERMEGDAVYRVKLDIRGYYDNIRKRDVRDVLIEPLREAFGCAENAFQRLKLEKPDDNNNKQKRAETVVDILLSKLFGWTYLDPQTGERRRTEDPLLGIPQGPALSAYAANVLLFPLDRQVAQYVKQVNSVCADEQIRVRYARYVDDMVILATDASDLEHLINMIHTYLRTIGLELSPKTDHADAVDKDEAYCWLQDERDGLGVSGSQLAPEDTLDMLWWGGFDPLTVNRRDALSILKGAADILEAASSESTDSDGSAASDEPYTEMGRFQEAFTACFRTKNVRYRDVCRMAVFLLEYLLTSNKSLNNLYTDFSKAWALEREQMGAVRSILSRIDVEPLAFLDGLLILLQRKIPATLPAAERRRRQSVRLDAARCIADKKCLQSAEALYQSTDGKNTAFLQVKVFQIKALAFACLWSPNNRELEEPHWTYTPPGTPDAGLKRYLQRWQYMVLAVQSASVLEKKPLAFRDFPADIEDDFQLFHHLTSCLSCCTKLQWFQELGSLFLEHTKSKSDKPTKIRRIERIWFLADAANSVAKEESSLALQTLSNFLQQGYLPTVVSQNPAMCAALFLNEDKEDLKYLPVPPVPEQEACYPGIFAISPKTAYRADFDVSQTLERVKPVDLNWDQYSDSVSDHWVTYKANLGDVIWACLSTPINESTAKWTPHLAEEVADLYDKLRDLLKGTAPILSKYNLFCDESGKLHALTYYHGTWTEPSGVALAGPSPFLQWTPIDDGPGKADRAAALLLEDLLNLRQYPAEKNDSAGNLLAVLSYGLKRLTGQQMRAYLSGLSEVSFARTVNRTLETWRFYAKSSPDEESYVLLDVALTDCLMAARLNRDHSEFMPGEDSAFLERWAILAIQTELPRLSEVLPKLPPAPSLGFLLRRSVAAWRDIGFRLLQIKGAGCEATRALGSSALLRAVCLDIRIRVLECVWAMRGEEMQRMKSQPLPLSLMQSNAEHIVFLYGSQNSQEEQAAQLCSLMGRYQGGHGDRQLDQITPAGWYLLLAWVLELDGSGVVPQRLHPERSKCRGEKARQIWEEVGELLFPRVLDPKSESFPYDGLTHLLNQDGEVDQILEQLKDLDELLDFKIELKRSGALLFERRRAAATQLSLQLEPPVRLTVPLQFVSFLRDGTQMPEYEAAGEANDERVWTQTVLGEQVLSVSAVTRKAAKLAWGESPTQVEVDTKSPALIENEEPVDSLPERASAEPKLLEEQSTLSDLEATAADRSAAETPTASEPATPSRSAAVESPAAGPLNSGTSSEPSFRDRLKVCQNTQRHSWTSRQNLNANMDRIAFFQFDVDDSYVHPLAECCVHQGNKHPSQKDIPSPQEKEKGEETAPTLQRVKHEPFRWDHNQAMDHGFQLYSCAEYRRRKLLETVLDVCDQFKVDILLLPEYSVRMETVDWMVKEIKRHRYQFSVWAGTCRLTPGRQYKQDGTLCKLNESSEDCKAILPIICAEPILSSKCAQNQDYPRLYLGRAKKYPAVSVEELINPYGRELQPVMKDPKQLGGRLYGDARDDVMELICAEVFLATNPGNMTAFARVYDMLHEHFTGKRMGIKQRMEHVLFDIQTIGEHTSLVQMKPSYTEVTGSVGNGLGKYGRTPILLVPAYTTRTVDYYVTAQAGFLATGLTTVFCNAVGLSSRGESCFIGTDCWDRNDATKNPFMPDYSPYHGALPGVYRQYDSKAGHGALGEYEQALVICDINPMAASGSRPRPESMLHPLTLVAHLPVIESVTYRKAAKDENGARCGPYDQCRCTRQIGKREDLKDGVVCALSSLFKSLDVFDSGDRKHGTTAYDEDPKISAEALEELGIALKSPGLKERADCYRRFHKANPREMPPATLLDWIWVDMDFPGAETQKEAETSKTVDLLKKANLLNVPEFTETEFQEPKL